MNRFFLERATACLTRWLPCALVAACVLSPGAHAQTADAKAENNFGFPVGFSVQKMDTRSNPRADFKNYAAGRWLDAAEIPGDTVRISTIDVLGKTLERQVASVLDEAAAKSAGAERGTPLQQVGDFYASGMDEARVAERGIVPLMPYLDLIATCKDRTSLARGLAKLSLLTGDALLFGVDVETDFADRTRNALYFGDAALPLGRDNYLRDEAQGVRLAYAQWISSLLKRMSSPQVEVPERTQQLIAMETRVAAKKLTPVEERDPHKRMVRMSYDTLKALLTNFDLDAYFAELGLPTGGEVIVIEVEALKERNAMLGELPMASTRDALLWGVLRAMGTFLGPEFFGPGLDFIGSVYGTKDRPERSKQVADALTKLMGHPLSQLYVAKYFPIETKLAVEDLVGRVRAQYRSRLAANTWLSQTTREHALEKLDRIEIGVGYPTHWIDYSAVDIRRDDYVGNAQRLNTFAMRRNLAKLGQPVTYDGFAAYGETLPVTINAGYNPDRNGIEIPAAFLQPPFYDRSADPAVNFCSIGAVIGHELTHGFDSQGRLYDAQGRVRDWWTPADEKYFVGQTQKLVDQANAFRMVPDIRMNGQLAVGENLADVGGIRFAHDALQGYLRDHPEKNKSVDGLSPSQRCFLSWAQIWADLAREGWLRQVLAVDPHPPGNYRMAAPSQHHPAFYEAFGIVPEDPMWLAPALRVELW